MDLSSNWKSLQSDTEKAFSFISDLRNVGSLMPEQIINWEADSDHCSFTIKGMTSLKLRVAERRPNSLLRLQPDGKSPFEFELLVHLREADAGAEAKVEVQAGLNPMMAMLAKRPLQHLVEHIADSLAVKVFD